MFHRYAGRRSLYASCFFLLALLNRGYSKPLYESMTPAVDSFSSIEIPLRLENGYPILTLHAGADSIDLALDTGAAQVSVGLLPETARALRLQIYGRGQMIKTNYGRARYRKSILPEAGWGGLTFHNLVCDQGIDDIPGPFSKRGIFGLVLLREFHVLIDYRTPTLALYQKDSPSAKFRSGAWMRLPFQNETDGIRIIGTLEGTSKPLKWYMDTGAIAWNGARMEYYNPLKPQYFLTIPGRQELDGISFAEDRTLRIGGTAVGSLNFLMVDLKEPDGVDGLIGADFFMKQRVFIDFSDSVIWIQPY